MCHSTMGITHCYKTLYLQFFYLNPQPWYQYSANKWPLCWNYTSGFDFGPTVIIGIWFSIGLQVLSE